MALEMLKKLALEEGLPLHTVAAEAVQIAFLDAFYAEKESIAMAFHGGTCIRLLHGGYRYSEDLDFAVPKLDYERLKSLLERSAGKTKHLLTTAIGDLDIELTARPVGQKNIYTWWLKVSPRDYRGKIHVKVEFGRYPVYQPTALPVTLHHPMLNSHPITISPSVDELFLDKINALAGRQYLKNRDFFDLWYLITVLKPKINYDLLKAKFADYHTMNPAHTLKQRLSEINPILIAETMERFLPARHRRIFAANNYREIVEVNKRLIQELLGNIL